MKSSEFSTPNADSISLIDSGVNLDILARSPSNILLPNDDTLLVRDVEILNEVEVSETSDQLNAPSSGLCRSRRSHFSRKDNTPDVLNHKKSDSEFIQLDICSKLTNICLSDAKRIVHTISELWRFYQNHPLCKSLPVNIETIRDKCPAVLRDQVIDLRINVIFKNDINRKLRLKESNNRNASWSKSFDDEPLGESSNKTNHRTIKRATSTLCIHSIQTYQKVATPRET